MMEFQHWPLVIKYWLIKMPEIITKVIKVFEIIVEMLKTLKEKLKKSKVTL